MEWGSNMSSASVIEFSFVPQFHVLMELLGFHQAMLQLTLLKKIKFNSVFSKLKIERCL